MFRGSVNRTLVHRYVSVDLCGSFVDHRYIQAMDVDPDSDLPDAGALEDDGDEDYDDVLPPAPDPSRKRRRIAQDPDDSGDEREAHQDAQRPSNLHPDDPANFLKLSEALKIYMSYRITDTEIDKADNLIRAYNLELIKVRGSVSLP